MSSCSCTFGLCALRSSAVQTDAFAPQRSEERREIQNTKLFFPAS